MINILAAFDEEDADLGVYFSSCLNDLKEAINAEKQDGAELEITEISSRYCNVAYFEQVLSKFKQSPFIWVSYTHGSEKSLIASGKSFIKAGEDNSLFQSTIFFTNSCLSGKILGPDLIKQLCLAFVGYDRPIVAFKNDYQEISLKCDNVGIISFLCGNTNAFDAYLAMKKLYTQESEKLLKYEDPLSAGLLINCREGLVFHGNKELRVDDLTIK